MLWPSGRRCVISVKREKKSCGNLNKMMSFCKVISIMQVQHIYVQLTCSLKKVSFLHLFMCLLHIKLKTFLWKRNSSHSLFFLDFEVDEKLLHIGKEMVRKCGYLPLVISLLGGLLSTRKSTTEWKLVNKNINAYLYMGEDIEKGEEIHGVLSLSYEDLPYYLKPCLLYMGQFKEDSEINPRCLYRMWIAQGMILHGNEGEEETLTDIAELYLSELASRCMVQIELEGVVEGRKYSWCCIVTRDEDTSKRVRTLQFINCKYGKIIDFPDAVIDLHKFKLVRVVAFYRFNFVGGKFSRVIWYTYIPLICGSHGMLEFQMF